MQDHRGDRKGWELNQRWKNCPGQRLKERKKSMPIFKELEKASTVHKWWSPSKIKDIYYSLGTQGENKYSMKYHRLPHKMK